MHIRRSTRPKASTLITFVPTETAAKITDFSAEPEQVTVRYYGNRTIVYCGIGSRKACTAAVLRTAAAKGIQAVTQLERTSAGCDLRGTGLRRFEADIIEAILLGSYTFSRYKTEKPPVLNSLEAVGCSLTPRQIKLIQHRCSSVNYARDLVNDNASVITPKYLASEAKKMAVPGLMKVSVLNKIELKKKGLNLITAVGSGSTTPPVLILMEYRGGSRRNTTTAVIGKGVTFDSGGQNLKPTGSIETMREDMAGAAAVLGVMKACTLTKPKVNLIGVIPAAHNAIGSNSYFPGDIYTSYSGKTVEIWSTDAEGRLLLADAIAYCRRIYNPDTIIDLATLTGGIISALGNAAAGLFSNSDELAEQLCRSGEKTGERLWRLPLYKEFSEALKGDLGDLRNISKLKKGVASSGTGAAFIREFTGDTPWAHLDIAGTAFNQRNSGVSMPQNATGFGVRLLLDWLEG